jgi:hypothetical protein
MQLGLLDISGVFVGDSGLGTTRGYHANTSESFAGNSIGPALGLVSRQLGVADRKARNANLCNFGVDLEDEGENGPEDKK